MTDAETISRLVGVYHASGTLLGELTYWVGARLGRTHCALCDITHGTFREKTRWQECRSELPVPVETVHLDERSPDLVALTEGRTPCVVAYVGDHPSILLDPTDLDGCAGDPAALVALLSERASARGLTLGPSGGA
ncbi:MAG: hypothetical protein ACXIVQ_07520 [Acidimicrobiales bacterium]